jgi:hypothetical protein
MKFSQALFCLVAAVPAAADVFIKEQFNDEVRRRRCSFGPSKKRTR